MNRLLINVPSCPEYFADLQVSFPSRSPVRSLVLRDALKAGWGLALRAACHEKGEHNEARATTGALEWGEAHGSRHSTTICVLARRAHVEGRIARN
jgi:hypothetical protein